MVGARARCVAGHVRLAAARVRVAHPEPAPERARRGRHALHVGRARLLEAQGRCRARGLARHDDLEHGGGARGAGQAAAARRAERGAAAARHPTELAAHRTRQRPQRALQRHARGRRVWEWRIPSGGSWQGGPVRRRRRQVRPGERPSPAALRPVVPPPGHRLALCARVPCRARPSDPDQGRGSAGEVLRRHERARLPRERARACPRAQRGAADALTTRSSRRRGRATTGTASLSSSTRATTSALST
mmetsp:Transcript_44123/g.146196  ORF Transcript_44123/g.146196 Transcript_44123/m.146196 type:complete len:247 (-) Transcript_44123:163-903(-)